MLTGELKLVYKTIAADLNELPQAIGERMVGVLASVISSRGWPPPDDSSRVGYTVLRRDPNAPELCPIDTVIEARLSYFKEP